MPKYLTYEDICSFYWSRGECSLAISPEEFTPNVTKNKIPYRCKKGHLITNLTKNNFNARINQGLHPCAQCSIKEAQLTRKNIIANALKQRNCELTVLNPDRSLEYTCSCGRKCHSYDNNVLKKKFIGCITCANPFNRKDVQDKIKQENLAKYGYENNFQREDIKQKIIDTNMTRYGVRNVMQNGNIFDLQKNNAYSKRPYTLPSGKIVHIMGYEDRCIEHLLENYTEDQLIIDDSDKPKIMYSNHLKNGKQSRYYPDLYIPSENTVIEVKSEFTLNKEYDQNMAKFKASVKAGYKLLVYVFSKTRLKYIETHTQDDLEITLFL